MKTFQKSITVKVALSGCIRQRSIPIELRQIILHQYLYESLDNDLIRVAVDLWMNNVRKVCLLRYGQSYLILGHKSSD